METVIDWSKWPHDAELHLPNQQETAECAVKFSESGSVFFAYSKNVGWTQWAGENKNSLLERFKYTSKAWTGEGIPPVGTHVVVHDDGSLIYGHGESGEVLAHVEGCAVIRMSYGLGCFLPRCLRTPDQIAAEERQKGIEELGNFLAANSTTPTPYLWEAAQKIYDAGYRKQVSE